MRLNYILILCTACLVLGSAQGTLLLKKKLLGAAAVAGYNKLASLSGTDSTTEAAEEEIHTETSTAAPAAHTIILQLPQPVIHIQPEHTGSYSSSILNAPHDGASWLSSLWTKSQHAATIETNRIRDRFRPLSPLSYLISKLHKKTSPPPPRVQVVYVPVLKEVTPLKPVEEVHRAIVVPDETPAPPSALADVTPASEIAVIAPVKSEYGPPNQGQAAPEVTLPAKEYSLPVEVPNQTYGVPQDVKVQEFSAPKEMASSLYPPAEEYQPTVFRSSDDSFRYTLVNSH